MVRPYRSAVIVAAGAVRVQPEIRSMARVTLSWLAAAAQRATKRLCCSGVSGWEPAVLRHHAEDRFNVIHTQRSTPDRDSSSVTQLIMPLAVTVRT